MSKKADSNKKILRVIDANTNRLKEALRVLEDIMRFIADDKRLTREFKNIRHKITSYAGISRIFRSESIIPERNIIEDVGKSSIEAEFKRKNVIDIFFANSQRAKESLRVLEEFMKLFNSKTAGQFKQLRYELYSVEKRALKKLIHRIGEF